MFLEFSKESNFAIQVQKFVMSRCFIFATLDKNKTNVDYHNG